MRAIELLEKAEEELKAAHHLVFVSLKYARTIDVIRNFLFRLLTFFDLATEALLWNLKCTPPAAPRAKIAMLKEKCRKDEKLISLMNFYLQLRDIIKGEYSRHGEYRKHIKMIVFLPEKKIEIDVPMLEEWFKKAAEFYEYILEKIKK